MSKNLQIVRKDIRAAACREKAAILQRFFKTGPGEYGEGDIFLGIVVPQSRMIAGRHSELTLEEIETLLHSKIHEERLIALLMCVEKFRATKDRKDIYELYLRNTQWINNWDLVDLSADKIIGTYLFSKKKDILFSLAHSKNVWERRIAMIATFHFIKREIFGDALKIAGILMHDEHDLIQKAVGWMLREIGKRSLITEEKFLKKYHTTIPRTMLRYAIERFPEKKRRMYLRAPTRIRT